MICTAPSYVMKNQLGQKVASKRMRITTSCTTTCSDMLEAADQKGRVRKVYENADEVSWKGLLRTVSSLTTQPSTG